MSCLLDEERQWTTSSFDFGRKVSSRNSKRKKKSHEGNDGRTFVVLFVFAYLTNSHPEWKAESGKLFILKAYFLSCLACLRSECGLVEWWLMALT